MFAKLFVIIFVLFYFLIPKVIFAQTSSCCSQNGGVYACNSSTSELYCKDGTISRECVCKITTPTPSPSPIPTPIPTLPSCVAYSTYDTTLNACKCNSGYIVKDNPASKRPKIGTAPQGIKPKKEKRNKFGRTKDEQELHEWLEDNPR